VVAVALRVLMALPGGEEVAAFLRARGLEVDEAETLDAALLERLRQRRWDVLLVSEYARVADSSFPAWLTAAACQGTVRVKLLTDGRPPGDATLRAAIDAGIYEICNRPVVDLEAHLWPLVVDRRRGNPEATTPPGR
jgi:hypothetical protein